ncbi:MAG: M20/M25/M40 family metallo-hydrolase [Gemmatimonadaceae bacterium]|nr:M20/M25/M40 family metallo-hydrolase [Gemmatimonadaceae bacterium]MCW5827033.1 M20/M25/M40 family metallo-hydrolase [Gemmatimonadaceae bacterium]
MSVRSLARRAIGAAALALLPTVVSAQAPIPGFSRAATEAQRNAERAAIARPDTARAQALARALADRPHIAGTPAQARTRDLVIAAMREAGLETEIGEYHVWLPHTVDYGVWRIRPEPKELDLREGRVPEDPTTMQHDEYPTVNGYSGTGDVTGEVVYVNYGLIEDYAQLDSIGVSVRGKIVIARYGRSFRGIKAREAEKRGALALLMYSDPQDDGYVRGDVYPEGPYRNERGVQRGSVMNGAGDPSTPGYPSKPGARRIPLDSMPVPRIPVLPLSYGNAIELLRDVRGRDIPASWQGGLPFRYHVGPGPVVARVRVFSDSATAAIKPIWNTYGIIRGTDFPDELVIIGAHRDAWSPGAVDNVSGTVSVVEAARAVAAQMRAGWRPRRTLVFATWDAEEWGLVGSTEYVEDDSLRLMRGAVAYLNQDVSASGPSFGGGGSPSLRGLLRDAAKTVPDPSGAGSVYDVWRARVRPAEGEEPAMGDPGGGSDFAGFYNHLGIPHSDWGFGGGNGIYHSNYDSYTFMERFGDPGYRYHAAAARIGAVMMMRLANADVLPYDYAEFARTMRRYLAPVDRALQQRGWRGSSAPLAAAIDRMERAAQSFNATRDSALAAGVPRARQIPANAALREVERAMTRPEGLRSRPWYRNLIYVADVDNGYGTMVFPSVNEAIRYGSEALFAAEMQDLVERFDAATGAIERATRALRGR